ncbi:cytochrome c4 [Herbaspirillum sp. HC18]|nr:cytochrome c4 [Herbaspirillum sp. HC18]
MKIFGSSIRRPAAFAWMLSALAWAPLTATAGDPQQIVSTSCVACHGADGNSAIPMFPKLAGLQSEYVAKQLAEFASGKRKSDTMAPIVGTLKSEDFAALGTYFASQPPAPGTVRDKAAADEGKKIFEDGNENSGVPSCSGCHQPDGKGNARYPRLAGQHADYLIQQLKSFGSGERSNDAGRVMRAIAKRMTEQEIKTVAEYISGM